MGLKVGELFVNLGIKGAEKTVGAVAGATKGMGELKSMSLEAKAAIAAAIYILQDLMMDSARMGSGLSNFNALTGMSTQALQQWQYAARQAGVSGEELTGSLKAVQNSMTNMLLGKGAPEGMAMLANKVGFDPARARDTLYVMQQLQKFAQTVPKDVGNAMLKSFGLSEGSIAAMRKNAFRPEVFAKAPTYSDREVGSLNKVDAAWANLGQKIQMAMGHFTAKHGLELVNSISKITTEVLRLVEALVLVGEKYKVFEGFAKLAGFLADAVESKPGTVMGEKHLEKKLWNWLSGTNDKGEITAPGAKLRPENYATPFYQPKTDAGKTQNIEVNQTLQFQHDGKDQKKTSGSVNKAVKDAFRQLQSQAQGS